jgi:septum formation protein
LSNRSSPQPPIVLASRSPQRVALLRQLGVAFRVEAPTYDEPPLALAPEALARTHARAKAASVTTRPQDGPLVAVDTLVVAPGGDVLGKPGDRDQAERMLRLLVGATHHVVSGLAVSWRGHERVAHATTAVTMRRASATTLDAYLDLAEWRQRAGGYAIQGAAAALVTHVNGCYPNVVGLPIALLVDELTALGYRIL